MGKPIRFLSGLWLLALVLLNPVAVHARYVGGETQCPICGSPASPTSESTTSGGAPSYTEGKNGSVTSYVYDAFGQRTQVTDAAGNVTTMNYDAVGNMITRTNARGLLQFVRRIRE